MCNIYRRIFYECTADEADRSYSRRSGLPAVILFEYFLAYFNDFADRGGDCHAWPDDDLVAGGALLALIAALFGFNTIVQVVLFCIVSGVLLFVTRPIAVKYFNKTRERTNADRLIGRTAVVTQDIDNTHGTGEVVVAGMIWTARASVENHRISKGDTVEILSISGAKLIVRKK